MTMGSLMAAAMKKISLMSARPCELVEVNVLAPTAEAAAADAHGRVLAFHRDKLGIQLAIRQRSPRDAPLCVSAG
ncbi:MAG: hypothetical protein MZU79_00135 [Anaerotruncus sp.]|nr:hypothetical protein [Anaerotruncus sp.]